MWYNDAEQYLLWVIIIACGWFLVLKRNKAKPRWRAVFLLIIGFGAGLYIGIETSAEGYLILPLGVLEKQLHELWACRYNNGRGSSAKAFIGSFTQPVEHEAELKLQGELHRQQP